MKKPIYLFLLIVASVFVACEDSVTYPVQDIDSPAISESALRTPEEAIEIASRAAIEYNCNPSRVMPRIVNTDNVITIGSNENSRSTSEDTLLYAVEYENNEGFALISASKATQPVFAVISDGTYHESLESDNPAFRDFLNKSKRYISVHDSIKFDTIHKREPIYREERTVLVDENIGPKTKNLRWGQEYPEGTLFNNKLSGCGPTALAIALAYLQYPSNLSVTLNGTTTNYSLNWSDLCQHTQSWTHREKDLGIDCCNASRHDMIARICREIGRRANADDSSEEGTGVQYPNLGNAAISILGTNHVSQNFQSYNNNLTRSAVKSGIAIVRGPLQGSDNGHVWIIDGYKYYSAIVRIYKSDPNVAVIIGESNEELVDEYYETTYSVYCNWGWRGSCNGYYKADVMATNSGTFTPKHILSIKK